MKRLGPSKHNALLACWPRLVSALLCCLLLLDKSTYCYALDDLLAPNLLSRMEYIDFYDKLTLKYNIVYENWPIARFCTPGRLSLLELRMLHHALFNGDPIFQRLSAAEFQAFDLERFREHHETLIENAKNPLILPHEPEPEPEPETQPAGVAPDLPEDPNHSVSPAHPPAGDLTDPGSGSSTTVPPVGGNLVSFETEASTAPAKRKRKTRANKGMSQKEWALKKAQMALDEEKRKRARRVGKK